MTRMMDKNESTNDDRCNDYDDLRQGPVNDELINMAKSDERTGSKERIISTEIKQTPFPQGMMLIWWL